MSHEQLKGQQAAFWQALKELIGQCDGAGQLKVQWQGELIEAAVLFCLYPNAFYSLVAIGLPDTAEPWAKELVYIARLVHQCVVQGYECRQQGEHLEVLPKHGRAQALFHTRAELFHWFCEQVKKNSNEECTAHEPE